MPAGASLFLQRFPCLNRRQTAVDENYAGIFFIWAGLKLWKMYCNSAEARGNSLYFSIARTALGGRGCCRSPTEQCSVWVRQVLPDMVFSVGLTSLRLLGLGSHSGVINTI